MIAVLLGVVVMQWSCSDETSPVSANGGTSGGILFASSSGFLDENGIAWVVATDENGSPKVWAQEPSLPALPVSVDEIKFWETTVLITNDNVLWFLDTSVTPAEWKNLGPWPGQGG